MLRKLASQLKAFLVVAVISLISLIFVLQFGGPQAEGCSASKATYAAKVGGSVVTEGDFRATKRLLGFNNYPEQVAQQLRLNDAVIDGLIERTLLAKEARGIGLSLSADDVMEELAQEGSVYASLGSSTPFGAMTRKVEVPVQNAQGQFDSEAAKRFIEYGLRRSLGEFTEAQIEEGLAQRLRNIVAATASPSEQMLWLAFVAERELVTIDYIRVAPSAMKVQADGTSEAFQAWKKDRADEVASAAEAAGKSGTDQDSAGESTAGDANKPNSSTDSALAAFTQALRDKAAKRRSYDLLRRLQSGASMEELRASIGNAPGSAGDPADTEPTAEPAADPTNKDPTEPPTAALRVRRSDPFGADGVPFRTAADLDPLLKSCFSLSEQSPLPDKPVQVGNEFVVFRLVSRDRAAIDDLSSATRQRLLKTAREAEERRVVGALSQRLVARAEADALIEKRPEIYGKASAE